MIKVGDRVRVRTDYNEDCNECKKEGYNCNDLIGKVAWISGHVKPYGVDLEDGSNCSYDEEELEFV
jgi:hypothetical protein